MSALPGDPPFNQFNNHYDVASYNRICNEFDRPGRERAKVPARGGSSEGQAQSRCCPHGLAHARANDNKHRKYNRLQQQAETGGVRDETGGEQRGKSRHKKAGLKLMAGGPSKINPPNSHPSNPIHKAATAESRKPASSETQQAQPTAQKIEPTAPDKTSQHEINKTAVIVGVVGLSALLFMAWR